MYVFQNQHEFYLFLFFLIYALYNISIQKKIWYFLQWKKSSRKEYMMKEPTGHEAY